MYVYLLIYYHIMENIVMADGRRSETSKNFQDITNFRDAHCLHFSILLLIFFPNNSNTGLTIICTIKTRH